MAGKRGGDLPSVVTFVDVFVDRGAVQPAVNPVDERVGEHEEEEDAQSAKQPAPHSRDAVVQATVASHFQKEEPCRGEGHSRSRLGGVGYLPPHLVAQKERVPLEAMVKDEHVTECREGEVQQPSADGCDGVQGEKLSNMVALGPGLRVNKRRQDMSVTHVQH